jgi:rubrerythrin
MDEAKKKRMIEVLKEAVMTEIKGHQLYSHAAETTEDSAAKAMFEDMAKDEEQHVRILQTQLENFTNEGRLKLDEIHPAAVDHGASHIIDDSFRKSLRRGAFEMAVIGIGVDLENRAISYYKEQAEKTDDADLAKLFTWLSEWEVGHLNALMDLQKFTQDEYWSQQGFSPM